MLPRDGFTLLELVVAIFLTGVAAALATGVFAVTSEATLRADAWSERWEERQIAESWLRQAFASADATREPFDGAPDAARFGATMWTPLGLQEYVRVEVRLGSDGLTGDFGFGPVRLIPEAVDGRLEYLGRLGADSPWVDSWSSEVVPPHAVRLLLPPTESSAGDTVLFVIGERG